MKRWSKKISRLYEKQQSPPSGVVTIATAQTTEEISNHSFTSLLLPFLKENEEGERGSRCGLPKVR